MLKIIELLKKNWIILIYIISSIIFELTSVLLTSNTLLISNPSLFLLAMLTGVIILYFVRSQKGRYFVTLLLLLIHGILDTLFITIYDMTGQVFDFSMLTLKKDAMAILESIPLNVVYLYVFGVLFSAFSLFGYYFLRYTPTLMPIKRKALFLCLSLISSLSFYISVTFSLVETTNFYDDLLYGGKNNSYSDLGIIGNTSQALASGFNKVDTTKTPAEITSFFYDEIYESSHEKKNMNLVLILCESFEWMSFLEDLNKYPNGLKFNNNAKEFFPNLYEMYENGIIMENFHSREKTDVSENFSLLGHYPTRSLTNYSFYENDYSTSLPNLLKLVNKNYVTSYFHSGTNSFYNRDSYIPNLGFDNVYFEEELLELGLYDWRSEGERNLDSDMVKCASDKMFFTDKPFFTYITTITGHGQYAYRTSLEECGYYEKLEKIGLKYEKDKISSSNSFTTYVATALELDKALGEINSQLKEKGLYDNTIVAMFGDHNTYYNGLSEYVKGFRTASEAKALKRDFLDLYNVPFMVRVPGVSHHVVEKFTTTADIMPTLLDLMGINFYSNFYYGNSALSKNESIMYSRSYNFFASDALIFSSLNNVTFNLGTSINDVIRNNTIKLVNKIEYVDALYYSDYLNMSFNKTQKNSDQFKALFKQINER